MPRRGQLNYSLIRKARVFLSSTSDYAPHRQTARGKLEPIWEVFDYLSAMLPAAIGANPNEVITHELQNTDVLFGIIGPEYGSTIHYEGREMSLVEYEHLLAKREGDCTIIDCLRADLNTVSIPPQQQRFIATLRDFEGGRWCKEFSAPDDLGDQALRLLAAWSEYRRQVSLPWRRGLRMKYELPILGLVIFGCVGATLFSISRDTPTWIPAAACAVLLGALWFLFSSLYQGTAD